MIAERQLQLEDEAGGLSVDQLGDLAESIRRSLAQMPQLDGLRQYVELAVVAEGLRIELLENEEGAFFGSGDATPSGAGVEALRLDWGTDRATAQRPRDRRPHRLSALPRPAAVFKLGVVDGPGERGAADLDPLGSRPEKSTAGEGLR